MFTNRRGKGEGRVSQALQPPRCPSFTPKSPPTVAPLYFVRFDIQNLFVVWVSRSNLGSHDKKIWYERGSGTFPVAFYYHTRVWK